jgi:hypothetical protein
MGRWHPYRAVSSSHESARLVPVLACVPLHQASAALLPGPSGRPAGERPPALAYASVRGAGVLSVTRAAVRGATDPARFERGQDYVDRVRSLRFAGSPLPCRVKGREPVVGKGRVLGTRLRR